MAFVGDQDASSSSMPYRVFLSFRGKDTRLKFTGHLYTALTDAGLKTFKDDNEINRGEEIKSELERGIQQSTASLIVFSENYASSKWCLDELAMILERRRVSKHFVLPLFYHVNPTDVRHQRGSIGEAFAKYEEEVKTEANTEKKNELVKDIERWKVALKEAADISGMELNKEANRDESKFIQQVVDDVGSKLKHKLLDVDPHLVSMTSRTGDISLWIQDATTDVSIMLICGMGGIGKTTIAKKVYNENYRDFDGCSFLSDIRERSKDHKGVIGLQKQLLSDIWNRRNEEIHSVDEGIHKIGDAICFKKVLLVLDDVDHVDQLKVIFKMQDGLFAGSKIIVTSRNKKLKHAYEERCKVHEVETLSHHESVELFSLRAFRQGHPIESYTEHLKKIVSHCEGLPLALQVLGSSLYKKKIDVWKSLLKKLDAKPDIGIVEKLKISFDCLQDDDVKNVFLHIACFFVGEDKNRTIEILDACEMSAVHGIDHLVDLCLLKVYSDKLTMHRLIKNMGRYIVRMESPGGPGERSRLWHSQDCFDVLRQQTGTEKVQALAFDMQPYRKHNHAESILCRTTTRKRKFEELCGLINSAKQKVSNFLSWNFRDNNIRNSNEMDLDTDAFARMPSLMFLKLNDVELRGRFTDFPKGLRWLSWHRCHLKCMPSDLSLEWLVCLEMQYSSLKQLWNRPKFLPALKILDLSHSKSLAWSPDFSGMSNLERLILEVVHKVSPWPIMLDKRLILKAMNDRCIDGPRSGGVERKRTSSEAGGSGSGRKKSRAKKPRTDVREVAGPRADPLPDKSGDEAEVAGPIVSPPRTGFQEVGGGSSIPVRDWENYQLKDDEIAPGILAVGARPALTRPVGPSAGAENWYTMDFRTYSGWVAAELEQDKHPMDCLKAFAIPADMEAYAELEDKEFERNFKIQSGRMMSVIAGGAERLRSQRIRLDSAKRTADAAQSSAAAWEERFLKMKEMHASSVLEERKAISALSAAEHELREARSEAGSLKAEASAKDKRIAELESELAAARAVPSYVESVQKFIKTRTFELVVNREAGPSFRMGYDACGQFVGEGVPFSSDAHGFIAYMQAELAKDPEPEAEPVGAVEKPSEGSTEDEIPMDVLYPQDYRTESESGAEGEEVAAGDEENVADDGQAGGDH